MFLGTINQIISIVLILIILVGIFYLHKNVLSMKNEINRQKLELDSYKQALDKLIQVSQNKFRQQQQQQSSQNFEDETYQVNEPMNIHENIVPYQVDEDVLHSDEEGIINIESDEEEPNNEAWKSVVFGNQESNESLMEENLSISDSEEEESGSLDEENSELSEDNEDVVEEQEEVIEEENVLEEIKENAVEEKTVLENGKEEEVVVEYEEEVLSEEVEKVLEDEVNNIGSKEDEELKKELIEEENKTEEYEKTFQKELEEEYLNQKKNRKRLPNENVKDYEVGDVIVSQNDNNNYEVVLNKNRNKKWKKIN